MSVENLVNRIIRNQDEITRLVAEIQNVFSFHPRAAKLMQKRKPFVVVAEDEPYYLHVYGIIRAHEKQKDTWTEIDEQRYQDVLNRRRGNWSSAKNTLARLPIVPPMKEGGEG